MPLGHVIVRFDGSYTGMKSGGDTARMPEAPSLFSSPAESIVLRASSEVAATSAPWLPGSVARLLDGELGARARLAKSAPGEQQPERPIGAIDRGTGGAGRELLGPTPEAPGVPKRRDRRRPELLKNRRPFRRGQRGSKEASELSRLRHRLSPSLWS